MIFTPPTIIFFFFAFIKRKIDPHPTIQQQQINRGKGNAEKKRKKVGVSLYCRVVKAARSATESMVKIQLNSILVFLKKSK
jgi:hypothetical protein